MQKGIFKGMRSMILKAMAVTLAFITIAGSLPSSAASRKEVEVKTKKQLLTQIAGAAASTIIFSTQKTLKFTIPATEASSNKKLIVNAPNVTLTNKATFKGVTLNETLAFTEKGTGNSLTVKAENAQITVAKGSEVKKMTIEGTGAKVTVAKGSKVEKMNVATDKIDIDVLGKAKVGDLVCKIKGAEVNLNVEKKADVNVTLSKKTKLTITGDKGADIDIVSKAKNSTITASVPIEITAEKDINLKLKEGAEGSVVDTKSEDINVKVSGKAKEELTEKVGGETVKEPEKKEEIKEKKNTEKEKEEKKDTTASQTSNDQSYVPYTPTVLPTAYAVTVKTEGEGVVSADLYIGNTKIASGTKVEPGTNIRLLIAVQDGLFPTMRINGTERAIGETRSSVAGHTEYLGIINQIYKDTEIIVTATEPFITFKSSDHGTLYYINESTRIPINESEIKLQGNNIDHFEFFAEPEEGYVPRAKVNGRYREVYSYYGINIESHDITVSYGHIDVEVEFISKDTPCQITVTPPEYAALTVKNITSGETLASPTSSVKAGDIIEIQANPSIGHVLGSICVLMSEGGNYKYHVTSRRIMITTDINIFVETGKANIDVSVSWNEERKPGHISILQFKDEGGNNSGGAVYSGDRARWTLMEGCNKFDVVFDHPGIRILSLLVNGVEKVSTITESENGITYHHSLEQNETEINVEAVIGKANDDYVTVSLPEIDNATVRLTYKISGKDISVDEGGSGIVPAGTEITINASADGGRMISAVNAGNTPVSKANDGSYKYVVDADTVFGVTTAENNAIVLSAKVSTFNVVTGGSITISGGSTVAVTGASFELKVGDTKYATVNIPDVTFAATGAAISFEGGVTTEQKAAVTILDFSEFSVGSGAELFKKELLDFLTGTFSNVTEVYYPTGVNDKPAGYTGNQTFKQKS